MHQLVSVQGFPAPLMVVTDGPPCDMRLTPGFIRIDSGYVPGATLTVSPEAAAQMPSWMRQYGLARVPEPVAGQVLSST